MFNRRTLFRLSPAIAFIATPAAAKAFHEPNENKALVRRFFEEVWSTGDIARRDDFLAPGYRGHMSGATQAIDRDGWTTWFQGFRLAFPDARFTIEDMIAEDDRVATADDAWHPLRAAERNTSDRADRGRDRHEHRAYRERTGH